MADNQDQGPPPAAQVTEVLEPEEGDWAGEDLEAEGDTDADADSAISLLPESTFTLISSVRRYQQENGRTYHGYEAGKYVLPNDERERERLDLDHYVHLLTFKGRLCLCPKEQGARRVLDMGTGTGVWAMEYADAHPEAEVVGVDLSPIQPDFVPPNCAFEIDDLEKDWTWTKKFDFIYCRQLGGAFTDWPTAIRKAYDQLEPGGYFESCTGVWPSISDDGTVTEDSASRRYCNALIEATDKLGRPINIGPEMPRWLEDAGFEDITTEVFKWPIGPWPRDPHMKEIGLWLLESVETGLEAFAMAAFTRAFDWTKEEVVLLCSEVRRESRDMRVHSYFDLLVTYGRKPDHGSHD